MTEIYALIEGLKLARKLGVEKLSVEFNNLLTENFLNTEEILGSFKGFNFLNSFVNKK